MNKVTSASLDTHYQFSIKILLSNASIHLDLKGLTFAKLNIKRVPYSLIREYDRVRGFAQILSTFSGLNIRQQYEILVNHKWTF